MKRYEKAEERWAPKNKKKMILLSIGISLLLGPVGIMFGPFVVGGLYLFYGKITAEKQRLCQKKTDELNALLKQYEENYIPVAKKCKHLLFHREEMCIRDRIETKTENKKYSSTQERQLLCT